MKCFRGRRRSWEGTACGKR